jgi:hypothetical protein
MYGNPELVDPRSVMFVWLNPPEKVVIMRRLLSTSTVVKAGTVTSVLNTSVIAMVTTVVAVEDKVIIG